MPQIRYIDVLGCDNCQNADRLFKPFEQEQEQEHQYDEEEHEEG